MSSQSAAVLFVPVGTTLDGWELEEDEMPESVLHELIVELLVAILRAWITRTGRDARAGSNLALRWDRDRPQRGVDPDVYLVEPDPPEGELTTSLLLWREGHRAPRVCVEVVSEGTAEKDYDITDGPARYGAAGVAELWVFDPLKLGPKEDGGPWVLQVWRRAPKGAFRRVYQGDGSAFSRELGAWIVVTHGGMRLRIADDAAGTRLWPTSEEQARAASVDERTAREAAEAEVARLRALLAAREK